MTPEAVSPPGHAFLCWCEWGVSTARVEAGALVSLEWGELDEPGFFHLVGDPDHPETVRAAELGYPVRPLPDPASPLAVLAREAGAVLLEAGPERFLAYLPAGRGMFASCGSARALSRWLRRPAKARGLLARTEPRARAAMAPRPRAVEPCGRGWGTVEP